MSKVSLAGNASGTGIFTIASPNSNTDRTLTLPDNTGTLLTSGSAIQSSQLPTGSVLQVVRQTITTYASYSMNASSIQATALTASITPTSASSNIIVQIMASIQGSNAGQGVFGEIRRGTSTTLNPTAGGGTNNYPIHWMNLQNLPNMGSQLASQTWLAFDSPATTSSTAYTFYVYGVSGTGTMDLNSQGTNRASSVVLIWEIAG